MADNNRNRGLISGQNGSIVLYTTPEGNTQLEVKLENETVWISQQQMAMLFGVEENNITYHIQKIIKSGELQREATTQKIRVVRVAQNHVRMRKMLWSKNQENQ